MTTAAEGDLPFQLLLRLLELPDGFFEAEVLRRLGPTDLASLTGAGHAWAAAVAATALMTWAKHEKNLPLRRDSIFGLRAPRLCLMEACSLAARGGNVEVLKWLHSTGCPWNSYTSQANAAAGGHLGVLKWLHSTGCPWSSVACDTAAEGGHLEVLKWMRNQGCPWDVSTCYAAAAGGHLLVLQWLHNSGCPWDSTTCAVAAVGGHLATLQLAREHGCPWDEEHVRSCAKAAHGGNVDMLRWLDEQGVP
jgi:hypothetical protein